MSLLQDPFGRRFTYLRLSITDTCNFRCVYCLPNGNPSCGPKDFLSANEIGRLVTAFAALGVIKIRLTGGEPTVRGDLLEIVSAVATTPGIEKVALTTNGYRLTQLASGLQSSGLSSINVSVDSLDRENFARITGHDRLEDILKGIEAAAALGISPVKINVVLLRDINDGEFDRFLQWACDRPVRIRFIELMRTLSNSALFEKHHLSADSLKDQLAHQGWAPRTRTISDGPAIEYAHPRYLGNIGFIEPYAKDFCTGCNRLRVNSRGELRLCLFGDSSYSLRPLLKSDAQQPLLRQTIRSLIIRKPISHLLHEGAYGDTANLASIGG